jgi:hypothetical protein
VICDQAHHVSILFDVVRIQSVHSLVVHQTNDNVGHVVSFKIIKLLLTDDPQTSVILIWTVVVHSVGVKEKDTLDQLSIQLDPVLYSTVIGV